MKNEAAENKVTVDLHLKEHGEIILESRGTAENKVTVDPHPQLTR